MNKDEVEYIEIWHPIKSGGTALKSDGTQMKLVAKIVNGKIIHLEKDWYIEKGYMTKQHFEEVFN